MFNFKNIPIMKTTNEKSSMKDDKKTTKKTGSKTGSDAKKQTTKK